MNKRGKTGRILVVGYDLPDALDTAGEARHYRTLQFVEPLLADGHAVCLLASAESDRPQVDHGRGPHLDYRRADLRRRGWIGRLRALCGAVEPDAVLAVTFSNALRTARAGLAAARPTWMDLYGDRLAELQVWQVARGTARALRPGLAQAREILSTGDVFSTCGTPQKFASVGQLGLIGRLNRHTYGYEFVHAILPGAPRDVDVDETPTEPIIRGRLVPDDAFVVLWAGGYNVWTDVDTLFRALEHAMAGEPRLHFVSVGGTVGRREDNPAYERFQSLIARSHFRRRYALAGWMPPSAVPQYYRESDVGINLDAFHYETQLGTRTRLVEMMRYGLPVLTTLGCELSYLVRDRQLGLTCAIGDARGLSAQLLQLARDRQETRRMAERARAYACDELSFARTTEVFRTWARNPWQAPDKTRLAGTAAREWEAWGRFAVRRLLWRLWGLEPGL